MNFLRLKTNFQLCKHAHPQSHQHLKTTELNKNLKVHGTPWKFSKTPANIKRAPKLGEHNSEILKKLGYTDDENENLTNEKII